MYLNKPCYSVLNSPDASVGASCATPWLKGFFTDFIARKDAKTHPSTSSGDGAKISGLI